MSSNTYRDVTYHIIFSTKRRANIITPEMMGYLRIILKEKADYLGYKLHIANGREDHVHLLISASPKWSVSDIVKNLKGYSSFKIPVLFWQRGFGVLTVDRSSFDRVFNYIKMQ